MKLIKAYEEVQKINEQLPEYPWHVWTRLFGKKCRPEVLGNQINLGYETDYCNLDEAREAVEYLVEQLGGKVKWK